MCESEKYKKVCGRCNTTILDNLYRDGNKCSEVKSKGMSWGQCQNVKVMPGEDVRVDDVTSTGGSRCFQCKQNEGLQVVEEE